MSELRKENISQEVFDLYDEYAHNKINRRQFVEKLSLYAIGGITISSLLSFIMPDYKTTALIKKDDSRIKNKYIHYDSPEGGGRIKGLLSWPAKEKNKLPGIVVVHENRGLILISKMLAEELQLKVLSPWHQTH